MLARIRTQVLAPAFALLPEELNSVAAQVLLLSIGWQESRFIYRRQLGGPARGFWSLRRADVQGLLEDPATADLVRRLCVRLDVGCSAAVILQALEFNDVLAAAMARLRLAQVFPLPEVLDARAGWLLYLQLWQPHHPCRHSWLLMHARACETVTGLPMAIRQAG